MIDLSELSDIEIYNLSEHGLTYSQVIYALADKSSLTRQREITELKLERHKLISKQLNKQSSETSSPTNILSTLFENPYVSEEFELDTKLHRNLTQALNTNRIIALGYETPRKVNSRLMQVPSDIIAIKRQTIFYIFSDKNTFKKGAFSFQDVCFVWRRFVDEALKKAKNPEPTKIIIETPPPRNKAGRPPTKEITLKSYIECRKLSLIDFSKFKKDAVFTVRSHIKNNYPQEFGDGKGFDNKTILKHISKEFDANKLKYKTL